MDKTHFMSRFPPLLSWLFSPPLPTSTGALQFPFELHKREIIGNLTYVSVMRCKRVHEQGDPFAPKLMTWLTLTAERDSLLHPLPICLALSTNQSNESTIQCKYLHELWWDGSTQKNRDNSNALLEILNTHLSATVIELCAKQAAETQLASHEVVLTVSSLRIQQTWSNSSNNLSHMKRYVEPPEECKSNTNSPFCSVWFFVNS